MVTATVRYGKDTWAGSGKPSANHNGADRLRLISGGSYAYIYLKTPVPHGQTVTSAKLQVYAAKTADWTGSKTLTARRIGDSWKPGKLTWNNKPGVTGATMPTVTVSGAANGQLLEFDVTTHLQTVSNGSNHYGWRIETGSSTAHRIYGFDSAYPPRLLVTYSDDPSEPTDLSPQGGAVSIAKPYLSFSATDLANPGEIASLQVQIDPAASTAAPGFDSAEVVTSVPELDLSGTSYAGLADGASTQWRARVKNSAGVWSDWSDWVTFSRDTKGTLTITNPGTAPNDYVSEATPPIIWSFTGETQAAWLVRIVDPADPTHIYAESGKKDGTDNSWTIPKKVIHDGRTYRALVRVWDAKDRVGTPGDPRYVQATQDFTFNEDATVTAPASLTAAQEGATPWVLLSWTRGTAPDSFTILRDGKNIVADVDPADVLVSGTTYQWRDPEAHPAETHTYAVRAVVNGKASAKSNTASVSTEPSGIWLLDTTNDISAVIFGDDAGSWAMPDDAATYNVIGSERVVRVVAGMRGLEGSISGVLVDALGFSAVDQEAALMAMKSHPAATYQLVLADTSIPVEVGNLTVAPTPLSRGADIYKVVSFDFWQVGNLPFDPVA